MAVSDALEVEDGNLVEVSGNVILTGKVSGTGNVVRIDFEGRRSQIEVRINGDHNTVVIEKPRGTRGLQVRVGNHVPASHCNLHIAPGFSCEPGTQFLLYNDGNTVTVGEDCMFSSNVKVRAGESPHLIFDAATGDYLDRSDGVVIGDHVWIGEGVYITKKVSIADGCIVGAHAVVTRRFTEIQAVLAGNPAVVVREGISWVRNKSLLKSGTPEAEGYARYRQELSARFDV